MSELTQCNYCKFEIIKDRAKDEGLSVIVKTNQIFGGVDIYLKDKKDEERWFAWFMELKDHCVC